MRLCVFFIWIYTTSQFLLCEQCHFLPRAMRSQDVSLAVCRGVETAKHCPLGPSLCSVVYVCTQLHKGRVQREARQKYLG